MVRYLFGIQVHEGEFGGTQLVVWVIANFVGVASLGLCYSSEDGLGKVRHFWARSGLQQVIPAYAPPPPPH